MQKGPQKSSKMKSKLIRGLNLEIRSDFVSGIIFNDTGILPGTLATAELVFGADAGGCVPRLAG